MIKIEIWAKIEKLNYEVSTFGRVRSLVTKKVLTQTVTRYGYLRVWLYDNGKKKEYKTHRLEAKAFLLNLEGKQEVNHEDSNKQNNNLSNLTWSTQSENIKHSVAKGTHKGVFNIGHKDTTTLSSGAVLQILGMKGGNQSEIAKRFNISRSHVNNILNGKKRTKCQP